MRAIDEPFYRFPYLSWIKVASYQFHAVSCRKTSVLMGESSIVITLYYAVLVLLSWTLCIALHSILYWNYSSIGYTFVYSLIALNEHNNVDIMKLKK